MNNQPNHGKIPDDIVDDVLELASRLYSEQTNSYSLEELKAAGEQVQIPPEFIEQAVTQVKEQKRLEAEKQLNQQALNQKIKWFSGGIAVLTVLWGIVTYNYLNAQSQQVELAWALVETQLQRRTNLITNMTNLPGLQANQKKEILTLLNNSQQSHQKADKIDEKVEARSQEDQAIQLFNKMITNQPGISEQTLDTWQNEMTGTANRIATQQKRYNLAVQQYNQKISAFPNSIVAGLAGFEPKPFFSGK
jgi:LemA protein